MSSSAPPSPTAIARVEPLTHTRAVRGPFDYKLRAGRSEVGVGSLLRVPFGGRTTLGVVVELAGESELEDEPAGRAGGGPGGGIAAGSSGAGDVAGRGDVLDARASALADARARQRERGPQPGSAGRLDHGAGDRSARRHRAADRAPARRARAPSRRGPGGRRRGRYAAAAAAGAPRAGGARAPRPAPAPGAAGGGARVRAPEHLADARPTPSARRGARRALRAARRDSSCCTA